MDKQGSLNMEWFYLFLATACEIFGVVIMKELVSTKNKLYLLALIVCFGFSFTSLSLSMQNMYERCLCYMDRSWNRWWGNDRSAFL